MYIYICIYRDTYIHKYIEDVYLLHKPILP